MSAVKEQGFTPIRKIGKEILYDDKSGEVIFVPLHGEGAGQVAPETLDIEKARDAGELPYILGAIGCVLGEDGKLIPFDRYRADENMALRVDPFNTEDCLKYPHLCSMYDENDIGYSRGLGEVFVDRLNDYIEYEAEDDDAIEETYRELGLIMPYHTIVVSP